MPLTIQLDLSRCVAYGVCVAVSPEHFDVPEGSPVARLVRDDCRDDERERVLDAVRGCPAAAIALVDDEGGPA